MRFVFVAVLLATFCCGNFSLLQAKDSEPRQFYSQWMKAGRAYSFRIHHFKPNPADKEYEQQYVIYYSAKDDYLFFFDPEAGEYWGRWQRNADREKRFSLIDKANRAAKLQDIPEPAFTDPTELPFLPNSSDGVRIASPSEAGNSREVNTPEDLSNLPPEEEFTPEIAEAPAAQPTQQELPNVRKVVRERQTVRITRRAPQTAIRYKTVWETEYERVWVPTYNVTPVVINGVATQVFTRGGYWKTVPVKKKKFVPYNPAGTGFYGP